MSDPESITGNEFLTKFILPSCTENHNYLLRLLRESQESHLAQIVKAEDDAEKVKLSNQMTNSNLAIIAKLVTVDDLIVRICGR